MEPWINHTQATLMVINHTPLCCGSACIGGVVCIRWSLTSKIVHKNSSLVMETDYKNSSLVMETDSKLSDLVEEYLSDATWDQYPLLLWLN